MRKSLIAICIFMFLLLVVKTSEAQSPYESSCGSTLFQASQLPLNPQDGFFKPNRTDTINGSPISSSSYFPVLIVFVQFLDDANDNIWPNTCDTSGPIYRDSLIADIKNNNSNWWNAYDQNKETFSNYFLQLSLGRFHVLGKAYSVRLDSNASYYRNTGVGIAAMNVEIWNKLNQKYSINWAWYDKWSWNGTNFEYGSDNNVDFIYKIHKTTGGVLPEYDGYSSLDGSDFKVDTLRWIRSGYGYTSSGITCARNLMKNNVTGICIHEHGHYTFSNGHLIYGRNSYAIGVEAFYSPYEMILSGYMTPRTATFGQSNILGDYSSRSNNDGEVIKVPISETEFFLLANRSKVCYWDRLMLGDTAFYDPYNTSDYGKGLYIYHVFDGIYRPTADWCSPHDLECADGYYRWEATGWASVDMNCWTSGNVWKTYNKAEVLYENDPSLHGTHLLNTLKGDGLSLHDFFSYNSNGSPNGYTIKHSFGDPPVDNCHLGTNRIFTTNEELYTSYDNIGDRWDAWKPGYNEVFSPYSSPNTFSRSNDTTGIFIYYDSLNGNTANIKIYRATEFGGETDLADILEATPPSRPMGLNVSVSDCIDNKLYPVLTWNHNMEPDMMGEKPEKRYKIFRAYNQYGTVPDDYFEVADLLIPEDEQPVYMDLDAWNSCWGWGILQNSIRYKIVAIDNTNWASVYSDFVSFSSEDLERGDNMGNLVNNNTVKKYELSQNYPNPFNPVTKINYALPKQGFVSLKIYDITGREIQTLVNEVKQTGYYTVDFNGSQLSSGVYFYKIKSGNFISVKRMVLIK
ncbi:MAG: T9SS type A sorting domain-containing protein [Candidatus Kapaibacterium sp.]